MRSAVESSKSDSSCILFYNPYSIVKELPIAKIDAELYHWMALTADSRGLILRRGGGWMIRAMVELIGIEPTTPCLQSRCSPN